MKLWSSLRFKITAMLVLILVPLLTFMSYINIYGIDRVKSQTAKSYSDLLSLHAAEIEQKMDELRVYLANLVYVDESVATILLHKFESNGYKLTEEDLLAKFTKALSFYDIADMFFIYVQRDDHLAIRGKSSLYVSGNSEKYAYLKSNIKRMVKDMKSTGSREWHVSDANGYGVMEKLFYNSQGIYIGVLVDLNNVIKPLDSINIIEGGYLLGIADKGRWLGDNELPAAILKEAMRKMEQARPEEPPQTIKDGKTSYLMVKKQLSIADVGFITIIPEENLLKEMLLFRKIILLLPFAALIILILYMFSIQKVLFGPMKELIKTMRQSAREDLRVKMKERGASEFIFIAQAFNQMIGEIRHLKINVYEEKIRTQKAEYKQLQNQIHPHFFANSLNTVYNLAAEGKCESIQKMSQHLAAYSRFVMRPGTSLISLKAELEHVRNYLEIQKFRFTDNLSFDILVDEEMRDFAIPPLVVQTFVENSIIHGFNEWNEPLHIEVRAGFVTTEEGTAMRISIRDNGQGFPEDMLSRLGSDHWSQAEADRHIGIWNAQRRLKMSFEDRVRISFDNRQPTGASVMMVILDGQTDEKGVDASVQAVNCG